MAAKISKRPHSIPRTLIDFILLGPPEDQRQLQDSPLLGDVWLEYGKNPAESQDLLITPNWDSTASHVAKAIAAGRAYTHERGVSRKPAKIAFLQGLVAARLTFADAIRIVVPMTMWWRRAAGCELPKYDKQGFEDTIRDVLQSYPTKNVESRVEWNYSATQRFIAIASLILWAGGDGAPPEGSSKSDAAAVVERALGDVASLASIFFTYWQKVSEDGQSGWTAEFFTDSSTAMPNSLKRTRAPKSPSRQRISGAKESARDIVFQVSLNRRATPALLRSVPAVKGDAARMLFKIDCSDIAWAVLDAGIDGTHEAFLEEKSDETLDENRTSRVIKTFDFTRVRDIVSRRESDESPAARAQRLREGTSLDQGTAREFLQILENEAEQELPFNWGVIEHFIARPNPDPPGPTHGTHVAGIIGARTIDEKKYGGGMCPDIELYDFRVLGRSIDDTEFAVIAALQYIRYINSRHSYITIHGANLSLSIPHSVRNFACGRTPVCEECERVVDSGVVVVAAAGNRGYQHFETSDGIFENYAALSITDPGNADGVITVGATHRNWAHTYGVSFFSSRGPTGDGRLKPDLVAPGERIQSTTSKNEWGSESGTSMAAPHVSGAAAMLMARYPELVGHPRRIKQILCDTATDLGRERSFQGHGMLDVLRALQSI